MPGLHDRVRLISLSLLLSFLHGRVKEVAEAVKEKQLFAVGVEDVRDLLFNCGDDEER